MRAIYTAILAGLAIAGLSACTTISKEECREGDWAAIGQKDGAEGHAPSRLESHAKTCANFNITPDPAAYRAGWDQGILLYCTPLNGFARGRSGDSYHGLCPAEVAPGFLEGRQIGLTLRDAERRVRSAENAISSADYEEARIESEIDKLLDDKEMDRERRRVELRRLRDDLRENRRRRDDAEWNLRAARAELVDMQGVASQFLAIHGGTL